MSRSSLIAREGLLPVAVSVLAAVLVMQIAGVLVSRMTADIEPMAEISQRTGVPIEACVFIGSSPIRQYAA